MTQGDLAKAYEGHNKQITEERHKASEAASKMEVERKEMQRINDERMKELVTELEDLKADHKRLENDKIMSAKDHETERALLKSHIDNLEKQLKDRDVLLRYVYHLYVSYTHASTHAHMHTYLHMCVCNYIGT